MWLIDLFYLDNKAGFKKTLVILLQFRLTIPVNELLLTLVNKLSDKTFVIPNAAIEFLEMRTYSVCQKASATEFKVQILSEVEKKIV